MKNNYFDLSLAEQRLVMEQTAIRLSLPVQAHMMMRRGVAERAIKDDALWEAISHHRSTLTSSMVWTTRLRDRIQLVPP